MSDAAPILPYATPGDAGVPEHYAPVEAMIDQRCRPKDIRIHFRKTAHAVEYFGRSVARRFAVDTVGHTCDVCRRVCDQYSSMNWSIEMPRKKLELSFLDSSPKAHFETFHALCPRCHRRWYFRMAWLNRTRMIACGLIVAGLVWLLVVRRWYAIDSLTATLAPCVMLVAAVSMLWTANAIARWSTPGPIRKRLPPGLAANWLGGLVRRAEART